MGFWNSVKIGSRRAAKGLSVGSVKVLVEDFREISNEFSLIEQNLDMLGGLSSEEIARLQQSYNIFNSPATMFVKQNIGLRYGKVAQIYAAAQEGHVQDKIKELHGFIDQVVGWLTQMSTITDLNVLRQYFGNENHNHSGQFFSTFSKISQRVDEINKMLGVALKYDKILIGDSSKLSIIYDEVGKIVKSIEDLSLENVQLKEYYEKNFLSYIASFLNGKQSFDEQRLKVDSYKMVNNYLISNILPTLKDEVDNQANISKIREILDYVVKNNFSNEKKCAELVLKHFRVSGEKKEPEFANLMEDDRINGLIGDLNKFNQGNQTIKANYLQFFSNYIKNDLTILEHSDFEKISMFNRAIINEILVLKIDDMEVNKYRTIFAKLFQILKTQNLKSEAEWVNLVRNVLQDTYQTDN